MQKQKVLLLMLAALIIVRFGVQPWLQWFEREQMLYQQNLNREIRARQLLEQTDALNNQMSAWQKLSDDLTLYFPAFDQLSDAQLFAQQQLQQQVRANNAQLELFDWVTVLPLPEINAMQAVVRVRFTATPDNVSALHAVFERMPAVSVNTAQFNWQRKLELSSTISASYDLSFVFSLRPQS